MSESFPRGRFQQIPQPDNKWCNEVYKAIKANEHNTLSALLGQRNNAATVLESNGYDPLAAALKPPISWDALKVLLVKAPDLIPLNKPINSLLLPRRFLLNEAVVRGDLDAVTKMLEHGADANNHTPEFPNTALHLAAAQHRPGILQALINNGATANLQGEWGGTALHHALSAPIRRNTLTFAPTIKFLLEAGIDLTVRDEGGQTAEAVLQNRINKTQAQFNAIKERQEKRNQIGHWEFITTDQAEKEQRDVDKLDHDLKQLRSADLQILRFKNLQSLLSRRFTS